MHSDSEPHVPGIRHDYAGGSGVRLHFVESGTGTPVILLHGFPDFWYGWRHQIPPLAAAGFRAIAPDLRGYNRSDRPRGIGSYTQRRLTKDVIAFIRHVAPDGAVLVGHDWGGVLALRAAAEQPDLVRRLVVLNAPHPLLMRRELLRNPRQLLRSWYAVMNQLPLLPEMLLRSRNFAVIRRVLGRDERGRSMASREELRTYVQAFSPEYALTAALNYYRAAARRRGGGMPQDGRISVPTLVIWGTLDPYLDSRLLDGLPEKVADLQIHRIADAGHFVHWQQPERVNRLLLEFLGT